MFCFENQNKITKIIGVKTLRFINDNISFICMKLNRKINKGKGWFASSTPTSEMSSKEYLK